MMPEFRIKERAAGASLVFRVAPGIPTATLAGQLPHRERWVFLLLDGRRAVADLARLTQRNELDVASTLVRFLQWGSIEPVSMEQFRATTDGREAGSVSIGIPFQGVRDDLWEESIPDFSAAFVS